MDVPSYARLTTSQEVNYLINIKNNMSNALFHLRERELCVIKNCNSDGSLIDLSLPKDDHHVQPWILLKILTVSSDQGNMEIPVCTECCPELCELSDNQNYKSVSNLLCLHSRVAGNIVRWFENPMYLDGWLSLDPHEDEDSIKSYIFLKGGPNKRSQDLAIVILNSKVSLLWTVGKATNPLCSLCSSPKCIHYKIWKKKSDEGKAPIAGPAQPTSASDDEPQQQKYIKFYGHNRSPIPLPLAKDPKQKSNLDNFKKFGTILPEEMIPVFDENIKCKHGRTFSENPKLAARYATVFSEHGEEIIQTNIYYRDTPCKCEQGFDSHELSLFHLSHGRFIDYRMLQNYLLAYCNAGTPGMNHHRTLKQNIEGSGQNFSLTYDEFNKSSDAYCELIDVDPENSYVCENCGPSPPQLVGDGKQGCSPLVDKIPVNVKELGPHSSDTDVVPQATTFDKRIFIANKEERDKFKDFLTSDSPVSDKILKSKVFKSENSKMIIQLLQLFRDQSLPQAYATFLREIVKGSSIAGYIQVNRDDCLRYVKLFCQQTLNLRSSENISKLKVVMSELPALWGHMRDILNYEKTTFLPRKIGCIIVELLNIRQNTFFSSEEREEYVHVRFTGPEPIQEYYPNNPLLTYPKRYNGHSLHF